MSNEHELDRLRDPFAPGDIEWRVQTAGEKNGKPWARVLAYVTNRAIMDRLDEVGRREVHLVVAAVEVDPPCVEQGAHGAVAHHRPVRQSSQEVASASFRHGPDVAALCRRTSRAIVRSPTRSVTPAAGTKPRTRATR